MAKKIATAAEYGVAAKTQKRINIFRHISSFAGIKFPYRGPWCLFDKVCQESDLFNLYLDFVSRFKLPRAAGRAKGNDIAGQ